MATERRTRRPPPDMDKLRELVLAGHNKSEIRREMDIASGAHLDQAMFQLCNIDQKVYPPLPGGRVLDELYIGVNGTATLSKSKLERYDWIVPKSTFRISRVDNTKNLLLTFIEPETE